MQRTIDLSRVQDRFQRKILRRVVFILVLPAFALILSVYIAWNAFQEGEIKQELHRATQGLAFQLHQDLDAYAALLGQLAADPKVNAFFDGAESQLAPDIFEKMYANLQQRALEGIVSGFLVNPDGQRFSSGSKPVFSEHGDLLPGWGLLNQLEQKPGQVILYRETVFFGVERLSRLTMGLQFVTQEKQTAFLTVHLLDESFKQLFSDYGASVNAKFTLTNDFNRVITTDDLRFVNQFDELEVPSEGDYLALAGSSWIYIKTRLADWTVQLYSMHSIDVLRARFTTGIWTTLMFLTVGSVLLIVILAQNLKKITRPIQVLLAALKQVSQGDFEARIVLKSNDEIEDITNQFNLLVAEMESMVYRLMHEVELSKSAEMKQLQAQLNPHFLYNALDSVSWMIQLGENQRAFQVLSSIGKVLRYSIDRSGNDGVVTIREDLKMMKTYLEIHRILRSDKIHITYDIDEAALGHTLPKFLLQPILENAVVHGIVDLEMPEISIRILKYAGTIECAIADNGKGFDFDPTLIEKARAGVGRLGKDPHIEYEQTTHMGIALVLRRAFLFFGPECVIRMESASDTGTVFSIVFPVGEVEHG